MSANVEQKSLLSVQAYLRQEGHSLETLEKDYGVTHRFSDEGDLVILNYDQIDSPKVHPIVRECRQLVIHSKTWNLVAKSFTRFLNYRESPEEDRIFFEAAKRGQKPIFQSKEDGSIILVFNHLGRWRLCTRSTFGQMPINPSQLGAITWQQHFESILGSDLQTFGTTHLQKGFSYVFELCSEANQIIRRYDPPRIYLLAVFDITTALEIPSPVLATERILSPILYDLEADSVKIFETLDTISKKDPTFEGFVAKIEIEKGVYQRLKFKTSTYLQLHHLRGTFDLKTPESIVEVILKGELDELRVHPVFEAHKARFEEWEHKLNAGYEAFTLEWSQVKDIPNQKDFALRIIKSPYKSLLFWCRNKKQDPKTVWKNAGSVLTKILE